MLKLPLQLLAVALPMGIVVMMYNAQNSDQVHEPSTQLARSGGEISRPVVIDRVTSAAFAELDSSTDVLVIGKQLVLADDEALNEVEQAQEPNLNLAEIDALAGIEVSGGRSNLDSATLTNDSTLAEVAASVSPRVLNDGSDVKVKSVPRYKIEELPDNGVVESQPSLPVPDKAMAVAEVVEQLSGPGQIHSQSVVNENPEGKIHGVEWLSEQLDTNFVIQLESSSNYENIRRRARKFDAAEDLVIYPASMSDSGKVVYGLSYGSYRTLADAKQASAALPEKLVRYGSWIRQVKALKRQIDSMNVDALDN